MTDEAPEKEAAASDPKVELAARIRAAIAFKRLKDSEAAVALGIKPRQLSRYKAGDWVEDLDPRRLDALAEQTGVPRAFFDIGWDVITEEPSVVERLAAVEWKIDTVLAGLSSARRGDPLDVVVTALQEAVEAAQELGLTPEGTVGAAGGLGHQKTVGGAADA